MYRDNLHNLRLYTINNYKHNQWNILSARFYVIYHKHKIHIDFTYS